MLLISSVLGVLAGLSNGASSVLQRVGARRTHSDSAVGIGALRRLAHKPAWLAGIGTTLFGFGLQAGALATGPIALVQPLLTLELPCTLLLSGVVFGSRLRTREWSAALGMTAGLALLVVALRPSSGEPLAAGASTWVVALAANAAISLALTAVGLRRHNAPRAALLGLAAGAGFALTAALMSAITAAFGSGVGVLLSTWQTYVMIAAAPGGFFLLQNAIRAGRLAASQPGLTLGNPVISLAWGTLVFGERVRGGPWVVAEVAGALAVCGCTVLLARSPLLHGRQGGVRDRSRDRARRTRQQLTHMPVLRSCSRSRGGHAGLHDGYVLNMMDRPEDHRHHGPLDTGEVPDEEEVSQAEVAEGLERDPDSQQNFTEQHPDKARDTESD